MVQRFFRPAVLAGGLLLACTGPASAALGGDVPSVLRDHLALNLTPAITSTVSYDLYSAATSDGQTLREYVDHSGRVFAVSFQGPRAPELATVLGSYATRYATAAKAMRPAHHVVVVNAPDLQIAVMRSGRSWQGKAILPAAIPAGVARAEIR